MGTRFPPLRADNAGGHLWNDLIGWTGEPHASTFHLASYAMIGGGFRLIAVAWRHPFAARDHQLATGGPYGWLRHPQCAVLLLAMLGSLVQRPTIPTLVMFPVRAVVHLRLARNEEREVAAAFGPARPGPLARPRSTRSYPNAPALSPSREMHARDLAPREPGCLPSARRSAPLPRCAAAGERPGSDEIEPGWGGGPQQCGPSFYGVRGQR